MDNIKVGDKLEIHCYKHNGHIHKIWEEAVLLDIQENLRDYMFYTLINVRIIY